jgi:hypothetical protein
MQVHLWVLFPWPQNGILVKHVLICLLLYYHFISHSEQTHKGKETYAPVVNVTIIQHFIRFTQLEETYLLDHSDTQTEHRTLICIYNSQKKGIRVSQKVSLQSIYFGLFSTLIWTVLI